MVDTEDMDTEDITVDTTTVDTTVDPTDTHTATATDITDRSLITDLKSTAEIIRTQIYRRALNSWCKIIFKIYIKSEIYGQT
jgi:hypothetical protein